MSDKSFVFALGLAVGVAISVGFSSLPMSPLRIYKEAKAECEAPLPRDQHCKIIAIPEVTK